MADERAARRGTSPVALVLAESLPFPTLKGGDLRTWQHVNALAAVARVGVFGLCSNDRRRERVPPLDLLCWTTATDPALASPPPTGMRLPGRAWLLDPHGHPSDLHFSAAAADQLGRLLADLRPDFVLLEGLWMHRYLEVVRAAGCRTILDCHNIEAVLSGELARALERDGLEGRVLREVLPARTAAIERHAVRAVDQLWVCSDVDADRLHHLYPGHAPTCVVPNGIRLADDGAAAAADVPAERGAGQQLTLLFTGIFAYPPNALAAAFLLDEILPRLLATGADCRLLLVGPRPTPAMLAAAAGDAHVTVTGAVPEVHPYLVEATALAVPLFQGGGTRLKILEAFAAGLPVISTAKGAEGLAVRDRTHLLLAETAARFVDAALDLWRQPALAAHLRTQARALVAERYSWTTVRAAVARALAALGAGG